jgi:hypothetical protein
MAECMTSTAAPPSACRLPWRRWLMLAGSRSRADINATFVQPFVAYTTPDAVTYTLNTESTYDWEAQQGSVPVHAVVSKVTKLDGQLVSFGGGVRYWADSPDAGTKGFGLRVVVTLLFPT